MSPGAPTSRRRGPRTSTGTPPVKRFETTEEATVTEEVTELERTMG